MKKEKKAELIEILIKHYKNADGWAELIRYIDQQQIDQQQKVSLESMKQVVIEYREMCHEIENFIKQIK